MKSKITEIVKIFFSHAQLEIKNFRSHPSISCERINFESGTDDEEIQHATDLEQHSINEDSDDPIEPFLPHPNVQYAREPNSIAYLESRYDFSQHPNITMDRVKSYGLSLIHI